MSLEHRTTAELTTELRVLRRRDEGEGAGRDRVLHELRVHELELELQNRELRDAQNALEESRSRFQDLYDFAPVAYYTFDAQGRVLEVNLTGATMVGRDRATVVGKPFLALVEMLDPAVFWRHLRRCGDERAPVVTDLQFVGEGHELRHLQATSVPVLDGAGRPVGFRTAFTDITERVKAEEEIERLRHHEARLRQGFEGLDRAWLAENDALAGLSTGANADLLQVIADQAAILADAEFVALGVVDPAGAQLRPWVTAGLDPAVVAAIGRSPCAVGLLAEVVRGGAVIRLRDLREHPAFLGFPRHPPELRSYLGVPIVVQGRTIGNLFLANKRSAVEFDDDDATFIEMLAARAAKVMEVARLAEEVRAAVRARDHVLAIVSHDLRSPLSTIKLSAGIMARHAPSNQGAAANAKHLDVIHKSVERMSRLIDDLLQASTIEAGAFTAVLAPEAAGTMVDEAVTAIGPLAAARAIQVRTTIEPGLPTAHADRLRLLQVLANLLGNAVKFVPDGGAIEVRVHAECGELHFAVADNGCGIAADQLPHLFDRYWKGREQARHGTGLGLYIAKGIVDAHGGRMWATSTPGVGSTFGFTLPTWPAATMATAAPAPSIGARLQHLRVLIVDDEANAVSALAALLGDEGMTTIKAASAEQALARVERDRPDVAVIDLELPGMSGSVLLRFLRERFPGLPAVIASGHRSDDTAVREILATPRVAYIAKPIDVDQLLATLARLVEPDPVTASTWHEPRYLGEA